MLVASTSILIVAPSFGITVPQAPVFPSLPDIGGQGNQSATFAFSETHDFVYSSAVSTFLYFPSFTPDKRLEFDPGTFPNIESFTIQRYGTDWIIPNWYREPLYYLNKSPVLLLNAQTIVNNFNGTYSTFQIDSDPQYLDYVSFSPLPGFASMTASWNSGHGFRVWMYGNSYVPPSWTDQLSADLTFLGALVGYFIYFVAYLISVAGFMFSLLGFVPALAGGIGLLITVLFAGSLLQFIRGIGEGSNK